MNKYFLLNIVFFLLFTQSFAQCPEGHCTIRDGRLTTQSDVDQFSSTCTKICGNLEIGFSAAIIRDLSKLQNVTHVEGNLSISANSQLVSLNGLQNITSIGGDLYIGSTTGLVNIDALHNLTYLGGSLRLSYNTSLNSIEGLENLTEIGGSINIDRTNLQNLKGLENIKEIGGDLSISGNGSLASISELQKLSIINGDMVIRNNLALNSLYGLQNIIAVRGDLGIENTTVANLNVFKNLATIEGGLRISSNKLLTNILDLQNTTTMEGFLVVSNNDLLNSLDGLENITKLRGGLLIFNNPLINNLEPLKNITGTIHNDLWIVDNEALTSLEGLQNITAVEGYFRISDNDALLNLEGLQNISTIMGNIEIEKNAILNDISAIDNTNFTGEYLSIANNQQLNLCSVNSVCNFLSTNYNEEQTYQIEGNASNCTNVDEILENCSSVDALSLIECPADNTTTICAPVSIATLSLQDFSTVDDVSLLSTLSIQVEEQTDVQEYFTTTTQVYTISDEGGDQKTCQKKYYTANQFLQAPEVSQPGYVCQEDLWGYIKIGAGQYKIYADDNGTMGNELSTCNAAGIICSTVDFGVDTNVPGRYNFWATTIIEFPDGTICESDASSFYVDVEAKPVAELSTQNKRIDIDENVELMELVTTNKSGYWEGENIAYFSPNAEGTYKLYYTVINDFCERSYLLIITVGDLYGCTDPDAANFNSAANIEDGSCTYNPTIDYDFIKYPWLNNIVNPIDCTKEVLVGEYETETGILIYISSINGGALYANDGTFICEDVNRKDCLSNYNLANQTKGWSCFEGDFKKYDYIYTICEGENVTLEANYITYSIPCSCPPSCAPLGPPAPPTVNWIPENASPTCPRCDKITVSPSITTAYQSDSPSLDISSSFCFLDDGPDKPDGPDGDRNTITDFLVIVEKCPPAKTTTVYQMQKNIHHSFNMYPNPTSGKVFIDLPDEAIYQINLIDISGKVVKQLETKIDESIIEMDVNNMSKGIYLIELKNASNNIFKKLVIE